MALLLEALSDDVGARTIDTLGKLFARMSPLLEEGVVECARRLILWLLVFRHAVAELLDQVLPVSEVIDSLLLRLLILVIDLRPLDLSNMMLPLAPIVVNGFLADHVQDISILHLDLVKFLLEAPGILLVHEGAFELLGELLTVPRILALDRLVIALLLLVQCLHIPLNLLAVLEVLDALLVQAFLPLLSLGHQIASHLVLRLSLQLLLQFFVDAVLRKAWQVSHLLLQLLLSHNLLSLIKCVFGYVGDCLVLGDGVKICAAHGQVILKGVPRDHLRRIDVRSIAVMEILGEATIIVVILVWDEGVGAEAATRCDLVGRAGHDTIFVKLLPAVEDVLPLPINALFHVNESVDTVLNLTNLFRTKQTSSTLSRSELAHGRLFDDIWSQVRVASHDVSHGGHGGLLDHIARASRLRCHSIDEVTGRCALLLRFQQHVEDAC
eukprot:CAMPEP_0185586836 /NCGR_PEP_ID=MMETSP0434-20130131/46282_1 /TAXON_ID=626734 ORGANISM="Favella taraikaensis, Strain Fe Narragansett Bay" /NCGR_SAMPLE_ID=MMETSP0434 /ASSEMBLY_ACC=CAM_ASM_000379 /LENGTH=438 /DNA_ID=CAMNT_0028208249 /DNA_START=355 /DNA_END=1671 /DNA_ORIENTATION=-